ncbi:hypothetical protein SU32_07335 [Ahrensia marina]|uniref:DUF427 domain-containing protein n=1 Tax=Ahrensia marina TaxID=1514904 RepID=A0A0N0VLY3_9HYPH|nr:hypothetical protein SU32_07335 [Ahrensia marina]
MFQEIINPDNSEHKASISSLDKTVTVASDGIELARSDNAIIVSEQSSRGAYPPVIYIPLDDVSSRLTPVEDKTTYCPLKGDASYFTFNGREVAWSYDRPLEGSQILKNYTAFYADRATITEG